MPLEKIKIFLTEKPFFSLAILFTVSRVVAYTLFPFRIDFLPWLNQLLDVALLKNDLWNSLWYLHGTPPLYNLYVGAIVSIFPESAWGIVFTALHFLMGLAMVLMTYRILKYLKVSHWFAFAGGFIIICYPILFRFEIIPFYTYPLVFLILLSVFFLIKFLETSKRSYLVAFLFVPLIILLFRNFFHVIFYFIPIAIGFCYFVYRTRRHLFRTAVIVSILFLAVGLIPSIRNQIDYGIFSSSTWQGMQLYSMTYFVPEEKIDALIATGSVTPLAKLPRFQNPDIYYEYYKETPHEGHPALNALYKSEGNGEFANFNNWIYARAAKEYGENTLAIVSRYPEYFLSRFVNSVYIFFGFANYRYFDKKDEWLLFDDNPLIQTYQAGKYFIQPAVLAILFGIILWFLISSLWRAFKDKKLLENVNPVFFYILFIFVYTFGVANVVELGENYTARVPIDPLIIILFLYAAWRMRKKPT